RHRVDVLCVDPSPTTFAVILRTSVILHGKENVGARNLPRCPVSQPGIGLLDLLSVDDALAKNPVLVADTVSVERQRQRRCRLEKTCSKASESAVAEARVVFAGSDFFEIEAQT